MTGRVTEQRREFGTVLSQILIWIPLNAIHGVMFPDGRHCILAWLAAFL